MVEDYIVFHFCIPSHHLNTYTFMFTIVLATHASIVLVCHDQLVSCPDLEEEPWA